jgi:hypothetical protein
MYYITDWKASVASPIYGADVKNTDDRTSLDSGELALGD